MLQFSYNIACICSLPGISISAHFHGTQHAGPPACRRSRCGIAAAAADSSSQAPAPLQLPFRTPQEAAAGSERSTAAPKDRAMQPPMFSSGSAARGSGHGRGSIARECHQRQASGDGASLSLRPHRWPDRHEAGAASERHRPADRRRAHHGRPRHREVCRSEWHMSVCAIITAVRIVWHRHEGRIKHIVVLAVS